MLLFVWFFSCLFLLFISHYYFFLYSSDPKHSKIISSHLFSFSSCFHLIHCVTWSCFLVFYTSFSTKCKIFLYPLVLFYNPLSKAIFFPSCFSLIYCLYQCFFSRFLHRFPLVISSFTPISFSIYSLINSSIHHLPVHSYYFSTFCLLTFSFSTVFVRLNEITTPSYRIIIFSTIILSLHLHFSAS